jgi:hypothetical protein
MSGTWHNPKALGRFVIAATALVGVLSATSVAVAARTSPHSRLTPAPRSAMAAARAATAEALVVSDSATLGQALAVRYPTTYGGLTVDGGPSITVYMTSMPKGLADQVQSLAPTAEVRYAHSAHTLSALQAIHRRLSASWMAFQNRGVDIVGYAPDIAESREQISVIAPSAAGVALLDKTFGSSRIAVRQVGLAPIPSAYTVRVAAEAHAAGFPFVWFPVLVVLVTGSLVAVGIVLLVAQRRRPALVALPD